MEDTIESVLKRYRTVAVVGLSKDPSKDSYEVASFLKSKGFRIIPVNPTAQEIMGEKCYPSLSSLPDELKRAVEIVDIFRPSEAVPPIVDEAVELRKRYGKPDVIWMQLGISNEGAAAKARAAGMVVIQNRCIMIEGKKKEQLLNFKI
jgi:predicted CoA-binding protein